MIRTRVAMVVALSMIACTASPPPPRPVRPGAADASVVARTAAPGSIDVHVTGIPSIRGKLAVVLLDAQTYGTEGASIAKASPAVVAIDMHVVLANVPQGRYLVVVSHDENGNDALDTSVIGVPTEAYGFSRGARGTFGPPDFDDAAFDFDGHATMVDISLR